MRNVLRALSARFVSYHDTLVQRGNSVDASMFYAIAVGALVLAVYWMWGMRKMVRMNKDNRCRSFQDGLLSSSEQTREPNASDDRGPAQGARPSTSNIPAPGRARNETTPSNGRTGISLEISAPADQIDTTTHVYRSASTDDLKGRAIVHADLRSRSYS